MFLDRIDRSSSAIGQPEMASVAGLHLMSTRMTSRGVFLRLRRIANEVFEVFTDPTAPGDAAQVFSNSKHRRDQRDAQGPQEHRAVDEAQREGPRLFAIERPRCRAN
jgi:hypothetical protein